jgi:hypothetical protein
MLQVPDGTFHRDSRFHDGTICDLFTHEVFSLLLQEKLIIMLGNVTALLIKLCSS